jgi:hypothetical protein
MDYGTINLLLISGILVYACFEINRWINNNF